jgi:hypothetical protein
VQAALATAADKNIMRTQQSRTTLRRFAALKRDEDDMGGPFIAVPDGTT